MWQMTAADPSAQEFAPAKINLTLHVTGRREDGYHLLDSVVVFADVGDRIGWRDAPNLSLNVHGPMASGVPADGRNLMLRAARIAGCGHGAFRLEKNLPSAAGIGGGSSDAAAVLRLLERALGLSVTAEQALTLGADVPVCQRAVPARMSGIGETVEPLQGMPPLAAVLVNPGVSVATPDVFARLAWRDGAPMPPVPAFDTSSALIAWLAHQRNDLQVPAITLQPVISVALSAIEASGALLARMSGSGATCFGLFDNPDSAKKAARHLSRAHPKWWVTATTLGRGLPAAGPQVSRATT
jgi:4-diphosphocytidyl-2-C-methyl-D-erythritol kinase